MRNIFSALFNVARSKIMGIWVKLRLWFSPAFIKSQVLTRIKQFFVNLFNVKPRDKRDYYRIFNWLISKRLAFLIVITLGLVATFFIFTTLPAKAPAGAQVSIPTYSYRSMPLKFHAGTVRILGRDGYTAYEGAVSDGAANGSGTLFAQDGSKVYSGEFANNMYNGNGTFYYPSGNPQYIGTFVDNVFDGKGTYYRESGTPEYSGDYDDGVRSGAGTLYNGVGAPVYIGNFVSGQVSYPDFVARPTSNVSELYTGKIEIFESDDEYCVTMPEIDALYAVKDGSNTLASDWTVSAVYVLRDNVVLNGREFDNIGDIRSVLGEPLYFGATWVDLPEAVAWTKLSEKYPDTALPVDIDATEGIENVWAVSEYDLDFEVYIYTFEKDGLLYTFYFDRAGQSEFLMYSIEKA